MQQLVAPNSQKADARPISFILDDQSAGSPLVTVTLAIRPEDLTRNDPSRISVQQTLGGAWADNFGTGLTTISISGHTGWKRRNGDSANFDGGERFEYLFETVFKQWHSLRLDAVNAGNDPDKVRLIFADALDNIVYIVAPISFALRRSRSRPLLSQFQISMTVLSEDLSDDELSITDQDILSITDKNALQSAGLDSMLASIGRLISYAENIQTYVNHTYVAPSHYFLTNTALLYNSVNKAILSGDDSAGSLISIALMTASAGINIFRNIGSIDGSSGQALGRLMQMSAAYSNIFCVLSNALQQQQYYSDYNPLLGSSNCSSTSGGSPLSILSGINPFYLYSATNQTLPVSLTESAQSSMTQIAINDVVLSPLSKTGLLGAMSNITSGFSAI